MAQLRITDINKRVDDTQEDIQELIEHGESVVSHLNQQKAEADLIKHSLENLRSDFSNFKKLVIGTAATLVVVIAVCLGLGVL